MEVFLCLLVQDEFEEDVTIPLDVMPLNAVGQTYTVLSRPRGSTASGKFANILKFTVKEVDPATGEAEEGGFEDEYELEDLDVLPSDYVKPVTVPNFRNSWEELGPETEQAADYGLGERDSLEEAIDAVLGTLGMQTCEGTEAIPPNARSHQVLLSGKYIGDVLCLVRLSFGIDASRNVAMKIAVRSESPDVCDAVHQIIEG